MDFSNENVGNAPKSSSTNNVKGNQSDSRSVVPKFRLGLVPDLIGLNPWTLRFNDSLMQEAYQASTITRQVHTNDIAMKTFQIISNGVVGKTVAQYFAYTWYADKLPLSRLLTIVFVGFGLDLVGVAVRYVPFWYTKSHRASNLENLSLWSMFFLISIQIHVFLLFLLMYEPVLFPDYPVVPILVTMMQGFICGIEMDFFKTSMLVSGIFGTSAFTIGLFYALHGQQLNDYLIGTMCGTWFSFIFELPCIFTTLFSCTLLAYWFTLFAKMRFFLSIKKTSPSTTNKSVRTPELLPNESLSMWNKYKKSQNDPKFLEYAAFSLNTMYKPGIIPFSISFAMTLFTRFENISSTSAIIYIAIYTGFLCLISVLQNTILVHSSFSKTSKANIVNFLTVFSILVFHVQYIISPVTTIANFANSIKSIVMMGVNFVSLAGIQARATLLYVSLVGVMLLVQLIVTPFELKDLLVACSYFILYICCAAFALLTSGAMEIHLYEFYHVSAREPIGERTLYYGTINNNEVRVAP